MNPEICLSKIIDTQEVIPGIYHVVLEAPELARRARPGQFVMIRVDDTGDPLLRRPLSLCNAENDCVEIVFQVKGKGTEIMSAWVPGKTVNMFGPMGNGFQLPEKPLTACLVAGGIGAAPLLFLASSVRRTQSQAFVKLFMGGKSKSDVSLIDHFNLAGCDIYTATEDGTTGFRGRVTELFSDYMKKELLPGNNNNYIFGCGPNPMLKALTAIARASNIPCQVSLEAHMACGVGACLGCVTQTNNKGFQRVCVEGPVFDGGEIF